VHPHRNLVPELLHERVRDVVTGDETAPDEDVRQAPLRRNLLGNGALEVGLGDQAALDEQLTERTPGSACGFHVSPYRHVRSLT
jgi:hypothetical protein